ncbi:MAG: hypothetical protein V3T19_02875 [Acidiferrobacterales bacterium]|jgi:hypothetical protein
MKTEQRIIEEWTDGGQLIIDYVKTQAEELRLKLTEEPYWVSDIRGKHKRRLLLESGKVEISFDLTQIEDYAAGAGTERTKKKIRDYLEKLLK